MEFYEIVCLQIIHVSERHAVVRAARRPIRGLARTGGSQHGRDESTRVSLNYKDSRNRWALGCVNSPQANAGSHGRGRLCDHLLTISMILCSELYYDSSYFCL